MFSRGSGQPLYGEVGDGVEGQIDQLAFEVVLVDVPEEGLMGELYDGVDQVARGLVLEKHQKWTKRQKQHKGKQKQKQEHLFQIKGIDQTK